MEQITNKAGPGHPARPGALHQEEWSLDHGEDPGAPGIRVIIIC